jgi:hypothetical protein
LNIHEQRSVVYESRTKSEGLTAQVVWFADWFHQNITAGHTLEIDLDRYLRLRLPLARTLALPLRLWLRASQTCGHFEKRWDSLAESLGLSCYRQRSRVIEKLGPALDELQRAGMIGSWTIEATRSGDGLKVSVRHGKLVGLRAKATDDQSPGVAERSRPHDPVLLDELVRRGVHRGPALRLLRSIPADQPVTEQVAWFDQLIASRLGRSIQDPPACLYGLIRDGQAPEAPRRTASEVLGAPVDGQNRYQLLQAYNRYLAEAIAAHVDALPPEERERLVDEHLSECLAEDDQVRHWPAPQQRLAARRRLEKRLAKTLPIQRLCDFMAANEPLGPDDEVTKLGESHRSGARASDPQRLDCVRSVHTGPRTSATGRPSPAAPSLCPPVVGPAPGPSAPPTPDPHPHRPSQVGPREEVTSAPIAPGNQAGLTPRHP